MKNIKKLVLLMFGVVVIATTATTSYASGYTRNGVRYLYADDTDNEIICNVQALCDIALVKNDIFANWIMTKGEVWVDSAQKKISYTDNDGVTHVILQATGTEADNKVVLLAADNQYRFYLTATERKTINRYAFIEHNTNQYNSHNAIIDEGLGLNFNNKTLNGQYTIDGDVKSTIRPLAVFNDGKKTYVQMSKEVGTTDLPTIYTFDEDKKLQTLAGVRYRKPYFVIDGVKPRYALIVGSSTSDNPLRVDIKLKKAGWSW